ncbi:hypothetical protein BKA62DRAFT_622375 [Auriculariales sp. MPI-PUGE-AT-0066]|nr:hypothetical protein BKA62DRAFT_622375 [Auriculariales sp. MPI-PUGE-AT-0066]
MPNYLAISEQHGVARGTLKNHFEQRTRAPQQAHANQQILSPLEERALVDWAIWNAAFGRPFDKNTARHRVYIMTSGAKKPGQKWFNKFLARHNTELKLCRAYGLDPKRAKNFTKEAVLTHFRNLAYITNKYNIPPENWYNSDEKGVQMGGGRNSDPRKFIFSKADLRKYWLKSDNLELVTIIETTCADGTDCINPCFIGQPGDYGEWFHPNFPNGDRIGL